MLDTCVPSAVAVIMAFWRGVLCHPDGRIEPATGCSRPTKVSQTFRRSDWRIIRVGWLPRRYGPRRRSTREPRLEVAAEPGDPAEDRRAEQTPGRERRQDPDRDLELHRPAERLAHDGEQDPGDHRVDDAD